MNGLQIKLSTTGNFTFTAENLYYNSPFSLSVCRRSQTAGRNYCSIISGDVSNFNRIVWQYILSRVRVSVWPSNFFIREKLQNSRGNRMASACCLFQWPCYGLRMPAERAVTGVRLWIALTCTAVCVCSRMRVRVYVGKRVVFAIYDNKIWPRLIMIIIQIIILYSCIQIDYVMFILCFLWPLVHS